MQLPRQCMEYVYEGISPQKLRPRSKASTIEVHVARANSQGGFNINGDVGKKVYPGFGRKTFDERCYATVHAACLEIAEKVHVSGLAHIRDVRGLFIAIQWRSTVPGRLTYNSSETFASTIEVSLDGLVCTSRNVTRSQSSGN
ncbi:hypothetical protein Cob_v011976 [Colletotrichum orbiculare MAFF 240422]|uniref:Uncharacterized protein n=1 Tax=Colletotrichum orbiculare (strain 104-T / ATCC 96160 / CBS 514.97 / LARS 414 / MAFF 240422) TaxID=1213857 RepID=A0A484FA19_COLOR|nr:hypothetical protein Cob_v011976 [Colletotrichum orbiculare MAFF 240422]